MIRASLQLRSAASKHALGLSEDAPPAKAHKSFGGTTARKPLGSIAPNTQSAAPSTPLPSSPLELDGTLVSTGEFSI